MTAKRTTRRPSPTYFHGGFPGLKAGAYLLPASVTSNRGLLYWGRWRKRKNERSKVVFVTTSLHTARLYAIIYPTDRGGTVYEVLPEGKLTEDKDCDLKGISFTCKRALIVAEHRLTRAAVQRQRSMLMRPTAKAARASK